MRQEDSLPDPQAGQKHGQHDPMSKHPGDHLANERTFLAWLRTGLATTTFGFVVAKFGLFLRELSGMHPGTSNRSGYFSAWVGILMTLLGATTIVVSVINFLRMRFAIDRDQFRPQIGLALVVAVLAGSIGFILAIYLFLTSSTF